MKDAFTHPVACIAASHVCDQRLAELVDLMWYYTAAAIYVERSGVFPIPGKPETAEAIGWILQSPVTARNFYLLSIAMLNEYHSRYHEPASCDGFFRYALDELSMMMRHRALENMRNNREYPAYTPFCTIEEAVEYAKEVTPAGATWGHREPPKWART